MFKLPYVRTPSFNHCWIHSIAQSDIAELYFMWVLPICHVFYEKDWEMIKDSIGQADAYPLGIFLLCINADEGSKFAHFGRNHCSFHASLGFVKVEMWETSWIFSGVKCVSARKNSPLNVSDCHILTPVRLQLRRWVEQWFRISYMNVVLWGTLDMIFIGNFSARGIFSVTTAWTPGIVERLTISIVILPSL